MPSRLTARAHAKINLALAVGPLVVEGERSGFHPIASWFAPLTLHDTVEIERLDRTGPSSFHLEWAADAPLESPIDWPIERDLGYRAHALLQAQTGRELPVRITVRKRIPVGGGLGGGSSNAGAVLSGLNSLFDLGVEQSQLRALGSRLGSDVPYFVNADHRPRGAIVSGFGDVIEPISYTPARDVVLLIPPFGCPTGAVYRAFDAVPQRAARTDPAALANAARERDIDAAALYNDLADAACRVEPRLARTLEAAGAALGNGGECVHVTGSGSTMFVLVGPGRVEPIVCALERALPGVVVLPERLLGETP